MIAAVLRVYGATAPVSFRRVKGMGKAFGFVRRVNTGKFKIYIDPELRGQIKLDALIHESLHAADWTKEEEWVNDTAAGIAKLLWDLGYRCEKESK